MIKSKNPIIRRIWKRANELNQNFLVIIVGQTGSGKTYSGLHIAEGLDKNFTIDNVCFTAEEFMSLLNSGKLKKGSVIVYDECGVSHSSREWYTLSNKMINYVLQTFRHKNLIVIFTTPAYSFLDSQARKLIHAIIETLKIDFKKNEVITKYKEVQFNPTINKIYLKYLRVKTKDGQIAKITRFFIGKPSKELIKKYEKKKSEFTKTLNLDIEMSLKQSKIRKDSQKPFNPNDYIEEIMNNKDKFIDDYRGMKFISLPMIKTEFKIGEGRARQIKKIAENKLFIDNQKQYKEGENHPSSIKLLRDGKSMKIPNNKVKEEEM